MTRGVESDRAASYGEFEFLEVLARRTERLGPVHVQRFTQGHSERLDEFAPRGLLTIDARHFLDPTDPPSGIFLDDRRVIRFHGKSVAEIMRYQWTCSVRDNNDPYDETGRGISATPHSIGRP